MKMSAVLRSALTTLLCLAATAASAQSLKILHVTSYKSDWVWVQEQAKGFQESMGDAEVVMRTVDLDAKHNSPEQLKQAVAQTIALIDSWKPDLIYTTDDVAQSEVAVKYLNGPIPIVYSGVNKAHADYGFDKARNVTGVLEREHFAGTLSLLRDIKAAPKLKLAIVLDDDPTWQGVKERINAELARRKDVEVTHWLQPKTYAEYRKAMADLQGKVDAVGLLGIFRFTGTDGKFVDYEAVLKWTAENSKLPDFSFWDTRIERGTLCAVTVSGIEQGRLAGRMARRILVDKVSPASITPEPTAKGRPMISLARARKLGIPIHATTLLNAEVLTRFSWDPQ
ncbi:MAG: ABC transporter substrate binding protein [Rhodocyclaceae bacterium]